MSNIFENKGAMAATIVVAASNSLNRGAANYICDGVNDQVEIQAAIDACVLSGGGLVYLSEGTYSITAPIILKSQVSLAGAGWVTRLELAANCNMFESNPAAQTSFLVIRDMQMGGGAGTYSGDCFHIPAGQLHGDWYYVRLLITHFTGNVIYIESGWQHHVLDSILEQTRGNGTACFYAKPTGVGDTQKVRRVFISGSNLFARPDVEAVAVNAIRWEGEANTEAETLELYYLSVKNCQLVSRGAHTVYLRSLKKFSITGCGDIEERIGGGGYDGIFITDDGVTASRKGVISDNLIGNRYSLRYGISVWGLSEQIGIGINQYNLITGQKVYFDVGVTNAGGFRQQTHNLFMDVLAASVNHVVTAQDLTAATPIACAIAAQPDVPRNITITITDADVSISAFQINVVGVNAKGQADTEQFLFAGGLVQTGNVAFATITSVTVTSIVGANAGDILDVGIGSKLGLSNVIYVAGDVFKVKRNNVNSPPADYTVNATYHTVDPTLGGAIVGGEDFSCWFKSNLNIIA